MGGNREKAPVNLGIRTKVIAEKLIFVKIKVCKKKEKICSGQLQLEG
jgi:hypothetical protein